MPLEFMPLIPCTIYCSHGQTDTSGKLPLRDELNVHYSTRLFSTDEA